MELEVEVAGRCVAEGGVSDMARECDVDGWVGIERPSIQ